MIVINLQGKRKYYLICILTFTTKLGCGGRLV